jgi:hypothetical protein
VHVPAPRFLRWLAPAVVGLLASTAWAAAGTATAFLSAPAVELLSPTSWTESFHGTTVLHIVGQFRNDSTTQAASDISVVFDVLDGAGISVGSVTAFSGADVLGPGEVSPFEAPVFSPAQASYTARARGAPRATTSTSQPYHAPLVVAFTPCPNPDPRSNDCQSHLSGTVTNAAASAGGVPVDHVRVLLTLFNGGGAVVGANHAWVMKADTTTVLNPTEAGTFSIDRTGEPAWTGDPVRGILALAEPLYPIDLNPASWSFGAQLVGTTVARDVTLTNKGGLPIAIASTSVTGPFSIVSPCTAIAAGSSCTMQAAFRPIGLAGLGLQNGVVTIVDNAAGTPQTMTVSGTGIGPQIGLSSSALDLGQTPIGGSVTGQLTITNVGSAPLTVSQIAGTDAFSSSGCLTVIAVTKSCTAIVTFAPLTGGVHSGTLTVSSDALNAIAPVQVRGVAIGPALTIDPLGIDFSRVAVGSPSPAKVVTLTNTGSGTGPGSLLTITNLGLPAGSVFSQTNTCGLPPSPPPTVPVTLPVGSSCTVSVTMTPSAVGLVQDALSITDGGGAVHTVALRGTGYGPAVSLSASALNFNPTLVGHSTTATTLTLTNTGNARLATLSVDTGANPVFSAALAPGCGPPLPPAGTCTINVTFMPSAEQPFTGTLTVTDDVGTQQVNLAGTGVVSQWEPLSGILIGGPAPASWEADRLDVFIRGQDNQLWHRSFSGSAWNPWEPQGGIITANPAAVSWAANHIDVFARGQDNQLWQRTLDNGVWGPWTPLGGILSSAPVVSSWGVGRLDVFVEGQDRQLWHRAYDHGWLSWEPLGGIITANPAAVSSGPNRIDVLARGQDRQLWHLPFTGTWGNWEPLGGILASAPSAASGAAGHLEVFVQGQDRQLWHLPFTGTWGNWEPLGGILVDNPGAVARGGNVDVLVQGQDRALWHKVIAAS